VAESDDDLGFGGGIPDWVWKFVWTVSFVGLIVRPMLTWVRESRPMWQLVLLVLLWMPVVAAVANCWRQNIHFGINRWPGVIACAMAPVLTGFAELESLRPVTGPVIYGGLAIFGACWILREQKNGRSAEFPPELLQFVNRPRWKYVTPLKLDFWVIWLGMWVPVIIGGGTIWEDFSSGASWHRHWSFWVAYAFVASSGLASGWSLIGAFRRRLSLDDNGIDRFLLNSLWSAILVVAALNRGITRTEIGSLCVAYMLLDLPRGAMVRWTRRNSESGRQVYDSLEAPHLGI
jgi:hypothetical protein